MIIYDLRCELGHGFEGWFDSPDDFDRQIAGEKLCCPLCESASVVRVPSALHVRTADGERGRSGSTAAQPAHDRSRAALAGAAGNPAELAAALARIRKWVAAAEDVGEAFADEARRIHQALAPERTIRGVTTSDEAQALAEEGIPVLPLPPHLVDKPH